MGRLLAVDAGLDKLQDLLLAMQEGDEVSLPRAVEASGLAGSHCAAVLEALVRAGLMRLHGEAYVRTHVTD